MSQRPPRPRCFRNGTFFLMARPPLLTRRGICPYFDFLCKALPGSEQEAESSEIGTSDHAIAVSAVRPKSNSTPVKSSETFHSLAAIAWSLESLFEVT